MGVARRAGVSLSLLSAGPNWFVGFENEDELVLVAPSSFEEPVECIDLRWRCSHEVADVVLAELGGLFKALGRREEAARALTLRDALPVVRGGNA